MSDRPPVLSLRSIAWLDRLVPTGDAVVVRTAPDFDDQARELVAALARAGWTATTLLVDGTTDPGPAGPVPCRVVQARSLAGLWAYWRARVVVHSHGVYGSLRARGPKAYVNVWHGMPVKRLPAGSDVGRNQSDLTVATAPVHARHLAETWGLAEDQVAIVGLPRNDVLVREAAPGRPARPRPPALRDLAGDRPLVVWLPTFRAQAGTSEVDGVDAGSVTQLAGGTPDAVDAALGRLGAFGIVKPHPLAPVPARRRSDHLAVWTEDDLRDAGLTLYHLLAHADVLVSDHSSVWIDFLLTGRPLAFAVSDLAAYQASRGYYFDDVEALLPGPLVEDLDGLERELARILAGDDRWVDRRADALALHHVHTDDRSAERVAELVLRSLGSPPPAPAPDPGPAATAPPGTPPPPAG